MRVEIIDRFSGFCELEKCWNDLLTSSGENSVFLTFEWFSSFVRSFGLENKLVISVVREGGEVVGILPLYKDRGKVAGITCRVLRSISNVHTPKYDFIFKVGMEESAARALAELQKYYQWDLVELDYVSRNSSVLKALYEYSSVGRNVKTVSVMKSPFLEIGGEWDEYYNYLSKELTKEIDRKERKASRTFDMQIEVIEGPSLDGNILFEAFKIEDSGWKGIQGSSIIKNDQVRAFYQDLAFSMNRKGWFQLMFLKFGDTRVAFDYFLNYDAVCSSLKIGYNVKYKKYSPGMVLRKQAIKHAFLQRLRRFDFLGGDNEYKVKMANSKTNVCRVFIFREGVKSKLIKAALFDIPVLAEKMRIKRFMKRLGGKASFDVERNNPGI